eukprot:4887665-Prymnesium_polylepis.1
MPGHAQCAHCPTHPPTAMSYAHTGTQKIVSLPHAVHRPRLFLIVQRSRPRSRRHWSTASGP